MVNRNGFFRRYFRWGNVKNGGRSRGGDSSVLCPTVLLVDDDETHRNVMAFDFKRKGFRVLQAGSGEEAWALVLSECIHLVVTDIRMPDGDGVELLRRIKDRYPRVPPVILITGFTELNLADAKDWGAEAVFPKPIDRQRLLVMSQNAMSLQGFQITE